MLKQNKKDKQQDGHRWLLIGFLCLFAVCLVAQVKPTGQTKKAETPAAKTPNGTKQTDKDIKKEPEIRRRKYICFMPIRDRPTSLPDRMFRY